MKEIKKNNIFIILTIGVILLIIILSNILKNDMEKHIEKISKECASQGYGIKAIYTQGDKFYVCNEDGDK